MSRKSCLPQPKATSLVVRCSLAAALLLSFNQFFGSSYYRWLQHSSFDSPTRNGNDEFDPPRKQNSISLLQNATSRQQVVVGTVTPKAISTNATDVSNANNMTKTPDVSINATSSSLTNKTPNVTTNATSYLTKPQEEVSAPRPSSSFEWSHVDLTVPPLGCGFYKCFFQSSAHPQTEGYLIGFAKHGGWSENVWPAMVAGWEVVQKLPDPSRGLLLAPPEKGIVPTDDILATLRNLSESLIRHQTTNQQSYHSHVPLDRLPLSQNTTLYGTEMVVQKARRLPPPTLMLSCSGNEKSTRKHVRSFALAVRDKDQFARRYDQELESLRTVLEKEPFLWYDDQVLVDTDGFIYHVDLDRVNDGRMMYEKGGRFFTKLRQKVCYEYFQTAVKESIIHGTPLVEEGLGKYYRYAEFYHWHNLDDKAIAAAKLLGYDEQKWDHNEDIPILHKRLEDLNKTEEYAVALLGLEPYFHDQQKEKNNMNQ